MSLSTNHFIDMCAVSAREMRQLQEKILVLEDIVFSILESGGKPTSDDIKKLQDFDLIAQTLGGISGFFEQLNRQVEDEGKANLTQATETITLEKLRKRLNHTGEMIEPKASAGTFEAF